MVNPTEADHNQILTNPEYESKVLQKKKMVFHIKLNYVFHAAKLLLEDSLLSFPSK